VSSSNPAVPPIEAGDITRLLIDARGGGRPEMDALFAAVYERLKVLAAQRVRGRGGRGGVSLDATALVHEAYLRFVDASRADWRDRQHFFAAAAKVMRHIVIDHARRHRALKRGAGAAVKTIAPDDAAVEVRLDELLVIDAALERLAAASPRLVQVVELCFFAGLTTEETGEALGVTGRTVKREWQKARLLLQALLQSAPPASGALSSSSDSSDRSDPPEVRRDAESG
jgi:RNA polymerase sigma factor (TIGR02999 family)